MLMFVYGTLKRGYGNNRLMINSKFLGEAVTVRPMMMIGLGVPFVWPAQNGLPLKGEVFDLGPVGEDTIAGRDATKRLAAIDRLESNGRVYERKPHSVRMVDDGRVIHRVWIYEAMRPDRYGTVTAPDVIARHARDGMLQWAGWLR